jgi:hypothetical protein
MSQSNIYILNGFFKHKVMYSLVVIPKAHRIWSLPRSNGLVIACSLVLQFGNGLSVAPKVHVLEICGPCAC